MKIKSPWDSDGEEERMIMLDRHLNLLSQITDAIELGIQKNDSAEAEQGFDRMTGVEISSVLAHAVGCALRHRGIGLEQFLEDLGHWK